MKNITQSEKATKKDSIFFLDWYNRYKGRGTK